MFWLAHISVTTVAVKCLEKKNAWRDIDYRWIIVGALLPDLIDKPINWFYLHASLTAAGKFFGHSLLLVLLLTLVGLTHWRYSRLALLLAACCFLHDLMDVMWCFPTVFFWPAFGMPFILRGDGGFWTSGYWYFSGEALAALFLTRHFLRPHYKKRWQFFWKYGRV